MPAPALKNYAAAALGLPVGADEHGRFPAWSDPRVIAIAAFMADESDDEDGGFHFFVRNSRPENRVTQIYCRKNRNMSAHQEFFLSCSSNETPVCIGEDGQNLVVVFRKQSTTVPAPVCIDEHRPAWGPFDHWGPLVVSSKVNMTVHTVCECSMLSVA